MTLWYVDCFAGPWQSQDEQLTDTSIHIGLSALQEAGRIWCHNGHNVTLRAIFVEKDGGAFSRLEEYLRGRDGAVATHAFYGEFGTHVAEIADLLGNDPAFIFIDPTGFKGVAMDYIRPLLVKRMREVLVNVMFNDINRFKDDSRAFLREQMKAFFGLTGATLKPGLSETDLLRTYRKNLKSRCGLKFAADLAIPHPTIRRTWFRLVIGGKHPEVLRVFREVEARVVGREAASVRTGARERQTEQNSGQLSLLSLDAAPPQDLWYAKANEADRLGCISDLITRLARTQGCHYKDLWPSLLEERHITEPELARLIVVAEKEGRLVIQPIKRGRRKVQSSDILRCPDEDV